MLPWPPLIKLSLHAGPGHVSPAALAAVPVCGRWGPGECQQPRPVYTCYGRAGPLGMIIAAGSDFECFTGIL